MDFGKLIKDRRRALGLTLEQVGQACGVGKSTVRKWETGMIQNVGRGKLRALADILRIDPTQLIDLDDNAVVVPVTMPAGRLALSDEEKILVLAYHEATDEARAIAMEILHNHKKNAASKMAGA